MEPMTIIAVGSLVASAIAGIIQATSNYKATTETNTANLNQSNQLNQEAWARDDTSFQRAVADARAAGISPLAAVEHAGFNTAPIMSTANAPQMDLSGLIGALGSTANFMGQKEQVEETKRHNVAQENQAKKDLMFKMINLKSDLNMQNRIIKAEDKRILFKSHNETENVKVKNSHETYMALNSACKTKIPSQDYSDWNDYIKAKANADEAWKKITGKYINLSNVDYNRYSSSEGKNSNINIVGTGIGGNDTESTSIDWNDGARWLKAIREYEEDTFAASFGNEEKKFKWPIYIGNYKENF